MSRKEGLVEFHDSEQEIAHNEFEAWRRQHPDGYFLTSSAKKKGWMLHRADGCWHTGSWTYVPGGHSLTKSRKVCAPNQEVLVAWAQRKGVTVFRCTHCF